MDIILALAAIFLYLFVGGPLFGMAAAYYYDGKLQNSGCTLALIVVLTMFLAYIIF